MLAKCLDSLFHNISAWSKPSSGVSASQCMAGQANDLLRSSGGAPFSFSPLYKGVDWVNYPKGTGFNYPKSREGSGVDWFNPPRSDEFGYPKNGEGSGVEWFNPSRSTGFNYPKNGEGNCSNRVSAVSEKDLLRDSGEWSYGSRFSPSGASDRRSLIQ